MSTDQTETTSDLKSFELTNQASKAMPNSQQSTFTLPLEISSIRFDPCLSFTADVCNNGVNIGNMPDYCECDRNGIWTIIQKRFLTVQLIFIVPGQHTKMVLEM